MNVVCWVILDLECPMKIFGLENEYSEPKKNKNKNVKVKWHPKYLLMKTLE